MHKNYIMRYIDTIMGNQNKNFKVGYGDLDNNPSNLFLAHNS